MSLIINPYSVQVASSGPTPLVWLKFEDNLTDDGSVGATWAWKQAETADTNATGVYATGNGGGKAASFDGSSGMPVVRSTDVCALIQGKTAWTFAMDFKHGAVNTDRRHFSIVGMFVTAIEDTAVYCLLSSTTGGAQWTGASVSSMGTSAWHNYTVTYDGIAGQVKVYLDGSLKATGTSNSGAMSSPNVNAYVGNAYWNTTNTTGLIDNVKIWDSVVTP